MSACECGRGVGGSLPLPRPSVRWGAGQVCWADPTADLASRAPVFHRAERLRSHSPEAAMAPTCCLGQGQPARKESDRAVPKGTDLIRPQAARKPTSAGK